MMYGTWPISSRFSARIASSAPTADDLIDLVWSGPEAPGIVNRDTSVVVREMFHGAEESVLVAGYAVYQGQLLFKELADRMDQSPGLHVQMFLDVHRPAARPLNPLGAGTPLCRAFCSQGMARSPPPETLLRSAVTGDGLHETGQLAREVRGRGQRSSIRVLG